MPNTNPHGKICYIEIPATDVPRSSEFYEKVFGWRLRQRGDGAIAFDDTTGNVSGTWVTGRPPATAPGLLIYIWCDSVAATLDAVIEVDVDVGDSALWDREVDGHRAVVGGRPVRQGGQRVVALNRICAASCPQTTF